MAGNGPRGAMPFLAFLVGGLVVAIVVVGFFMYSGYGRPDGRIPSHLSLNVKGPHT
jgi:hypothetical protein